MQVQAPITSIMKLFPIFGEEDPPSSEDDEKPRGMISLQLFKVEA